LSGEPTVTKRPRKKLRIGEVDPFAPRLESQQRRRKKGIAAGLIKVNREMHLKVEIPKNTKKNENTA